MCRAALKIHSDFMIMFVFLLSDSKDPTPPVRLLLAETSNSGRQGQVKRKVFMLDQRTVEKGRAAIQTVA